MTTKFVSFLITTLLFAASLGAQTSDYAAQTTSDPKISRDALALRLKPLRKEQLESEVEAWVDLLAERTQVVTDKQVNALGLTGDARSSLLDEISLDVEARTGLIDRLRDTLSAFRAKGGEIESYVQYIDASTSLEIGGDAEAIWKSVVGWLTSSEGGIRLGLNILKFLATLVVFKILGSVLARIARRALSRVKNSSELLRDFFVNTVRKGTFFIGLMVALSMLEVDIGPFLAAMGAAGFVIAFALQGTLSNFASGIMILVYRPYDIGQVVTVAGTTGKVDAMSLVSTTLRLPDNQVVVVPNNSIWGDVITNVTGEDTRRVDMVFGCGYSDDLQQAQTLLTEIVTAHPKVLSDPEPAIRVHELADSSVNFIVRPWSKTSDYWDVYWDVTREVKDRFDDAGISIPFPQQDVHMHSVASV